MDKERSKNGFLCVLNYKDNNTIKFLGRKYKNQDRFYTKLIEVKRFV